VKRLRAGTAVLLISVLTAVLAGCATPQTDLALANRERLPVTAEIPNVPFFPQQKYYCGPAALAMVLAWSGLPVTQDDMAKQVYTPGREGSLRSDILSAARRNGRLAVTVHTLPSLMAEIAAGNPVLVFQNLALDWYPQWHYAVAFGYDLKAGTLLLHSGTEERHRIDLTAFERTWRRGDFWALVVLPPDRLPATAGEEPLIDASAGLARAKKHREAASAFGAIARRWPDSFVAHMGLGNARYASKDLPGAATAFQDAARKFPAKAPAWNNLAFVLAKLGRRDEAAEAARKAVLLGGADAPKYRETLDEITGDAS
jgi:tetratricopeptide (TPR) repeat protein